MEFSRIIDCGLCFVALRESQNAVAAKSAIGGFVTIVHSMDKAVSKDIVSYAVSKLQPRLSSFEESVSFLVDKSVDLRTDITV